MPVIHQPYARKYPKLFLAFIDNLLPLTMRNPSFTVSEIVCLTANIQSPSSLLIESFLAAGRGVRTAKAKLTKKARTR